MAKIFIDCTYTFATGADRGIARVVRNIAHQAGSDPNAVPIVLARGTFCGVSEAELSARSRSDVPGDRALGSLLRACAALVTRVADVLPPAAGDRLLTATVHNRSLAVPMMSKLRAILAAKERGASGGSAVRGDASVEFAAGDVIFLPDASWNVEYGEALSGLRERGVRLVLLCHDLLPLTHGHLCTDHQEQFSRWLCRWLPQADGVICNSESTRRQLQRFVEVAAVALRADCWVEACPLGGNLGANATRQKLDRTIAAIVAGGSYYLTVGAIEPRKNHALLLQAFKLFWQGGGRARSVWVGRWTIDARGLRRQLKTEQEFGRRLVTLEGVSDAGLAALYEHARAAIFPSLGEGFGLPVAEALFYGCPVLASDIPAHREVCGERAIYFDADDALSLAAVLAQLERGERTPVAVVAGHGLRWQQSVARMFELIRQHCDG